MKSKSTRKPYRKLPPETWKQIRRDYEGGGSPELLCRQYGLNTSTLFARRKKEGWSRNESVPGPGVNPGGGTGGLDGLATGATQPPSPAMGGLQVGGHGACTGPEQEHVRSGMGDLLTPRSESGLQQDKIAVNQSHLSLASSLRHRIGQLAGDQRLGAGPQGRMSRAAVDLATAIEKVQKIERRALEMDDGPPVNNVQMVILAPAKMDPDVHHRSPCRLVWSEPGVRLRELHDKGASRTVAVGSHVDRPHWGG